MAISAPCGLYSDPIVLAHARALLTSSPEGATDYIEADLRDAPEIVRAAGNTLDFSRPVAVMLVAILHLIGDEADPYSLVATLMEAVPPGSYLTVSHLASDIAAQARAQATERLRILMHEKQTLRSRSEVARFFEGLEMVEPGLVRIPEWRPDTAADAKSPSALWGGVGRKPSAS